MGFRYLIYRTDYGNTIIRESAVDDSGVNEDALYSDFVIPVNQPLYLWRESAGDVVPNTETNINNWLNFSNPPSPDEPVNYDIFTGYTATTQTEIDGIADDIDFLSGATDGKLNKVSGAVTGNVPVFGAFGNTLVDSGYDINDLLSGATGNTSFSVFTAYTATTEVRIQGIEAEIVYLSGQTDNKLDTTDFNSYTATTETRLDGIEDDVIYLSGQTASKLSNTKFNSYTGSTETKISGIEDDVVYLSGETAARLKTSDFNVYSAATKVYIDSISAGLDPKQSVRVATTSPIIGTYVPTGGVNSTGSFTGVSTTVVDGVTLVNNDRILVKNQVDAKQNGIYVRTLSSVWTRSTDMDGSPSTEVSGGAYAFVETGSTQAASGWVLDGDGILILNSNLLVWSQFSAANSYQGGIGININGNVISLNGSAIAGNNLDWDGSQLNVQITGGTLGPALNAKVNNSTFNTYTGNTETRLSSIEDDVTYLSGQTATKLNISTFNSYTATTDTRIDGIEDDIIYLSGITSSKLDASVFTGYTASTKSDEICLIRTGTTGIDINTVAPTAIVWNGQLKTSTVFSWTGGSGIFVNETGEYEVTYNIPLEHTGSNNVRSYGSNLILNNAIVINRTFAGTSTSRASSTGNLALPSIIINLIDGDRIDLVGFRTALSGVSNTRPDATILIKKKNTLQ